MRFHLPVILLSGLALAGCAVPAGTPAATDTTPSLAARIGSNAKQVISPKMEALLEDREEAALAEAVQRAATGVTNGQVNWVAASADGNSSTANGRIVPHGDATSAGDRTCRQLLLKTWKGAGDPVEEQLTVCRPTQASTSGTIWVRSAG